MLQNGIAMRSVFRDLYAVERIFRVCNIVVVTGWQVSSRFSARYGVSVQPVSLVTFIEGNGKHEYRLVFKQPLQRF